MIETNLDAIRALCREYGVARLDVFGSVTTDEFDPDRSDVDFLVTFPDDYDYGPWLARVQDLEERLSRIVGRDVDLVMSPALKRARFRRIADQTRQEIYDASKIRALA